MKSKKNIASSNFPGRSIRRWIFILVLSLLITLRGAALPVANGGFESGLTNWTSQGDVQATTYAALGDTDTIYSLLFQGVETASGTYILEFDYRGLLSESLDGFPDTFFASLYLINDLSMFDLASAPPVYDDQIALMDLDAAGPANVTGLLSLSPLGPDWTHFAYEFTTIYAYAIPVFEYFDFDGIGSNGSVWIDNVSISAVSPVVPEPGSILLVGLGLAGSGTAWRRRRTRAAIRASH